MNNTKTIVLSVLVVGVIGGYVAYTRFFGSDAKMPLVNDKKTETETVNEVKDNQSEKPYNDGTYKGDVVDAFFGPVEVKAVISGGKITNIELLQFPNKPGYTTELSTKVKPVLVSEAILVQSARVNIISGATQTSQGFAKSLASALTKAGSTNQPVIEVTAPK